MRVQRQAPDRTSTWCALAPPPPPPQLLQQVALDVQKAIGAADGTQYTASDAMALLTTRTAPSAGAFVSGYCEEALGEMDRVRGPAGLLWPRQCVGAGCWLHGCTAACVR